MPQQVTLLADDSTSMARSWSNNHDSLQQHVATQVYSEHVAELNLQLSGLWSTLATGKPGLPMSFSGIASSGAVFSFQGMLLPSSMPKHMAVSWHGLAPSKRNSRYHGQQMHQASLPCTPADYTNAVVLYISLFTPVCSTLLHDQPFARQSRTAPHAGTLCLQGYPAGLAFCSFLCFLLCCCLVHQPSAIVHLASHLLMCICGCHTS